MSARRLVAFHDDPEIKATVLAQLEAHRADRTLLRYQPWDGARGGAVGCTVHSDDPAEYESRLGIPRVLAHLEEMLFRELPPRASQWWPASCMNAIPVGADLSQVWPRFALWLLIDDIHGQIVLAASRQERELLRDAAALLLAGEFDRRAWHTLHERAEALGRAGGSGGSESVVAKVAASFIAEDVALAGEEAASCLSYAASGIGEHAAEIAAAAYDFDAAFPFDTYFSAWTTSLEDFRDHQPEEAARQEGRDAHYTAQSYQLLSLLQAADSAPDPRWDRRLADLPAAGFDHPGPIPRRKVLVMGDRGVGKTSLIHRCTRGTWLEPAAATGDDLASRIGQAMTPLTGQTHTRISTSLRTFGGSDPAWAVSLVLWDWDLNGRDYGYWLSRQFARGEAGFLLVADGTRPETLEFALALQRELRLPQPFWLLLNRCDLTGQWSVPDALLEQVREQGGQVRLTSARTGEGVEDAFRAFAASLGHP